MGMLDFANSYDRAKFKMAYDEAVKNKQTVFLYNGAEILTDYAKYLLQYLDMWGVDQHMKNVQETINARVGGDT